MLVVGGKVIRLNEDTDLLWRGRIQLGDEPGIYSDAQYAGLCLEFPVELLPYSGAFTTTGELTIIIEADEVQIYGGYEGHPVTVFGLFATGATWQRREIASGRLRSEHLELALRSEIPRYVTVRIEINSQLPPGLYDEIIVNRLSVRSATHFGYLGFRFPISHDDDTDRRHSVSAPI